MAKVAGSEPRIYRSLEEAKANPRHGKNKAGDTTEWTLWCVTSPTGERHFIWSGSSGVALAQCVTDLGWQVYAAESKRKPVDLKAALAALSEEERKAILAEYLPKGKKA